MGKNIGLILIVLLILANLVGLGLLAWGTPALLQWGLTIITGIQLAFAAFLLIGMIFFSFNPDPGTLNTDSKRRVGMLGLLGVVFLLVIIVLVSFGVFLAPPISTMIMTVVLIALIVAWVFILISQF